MTFKKPWFKDIKIWIGVIAALAIFGALLPEKYKNKTEPTPQETAAVSAQGTAKPTLAEEFKAKVVGKFDYKIESESYYEMKESFYKQGKGMTSIVTVSRNISEEEASILCRWLRSAETNLTPKNSEESSTFGDYCLYEIRPIDVKHKPDYKVEVHFHDVKFMPLDYKPKITRTVKV